MNSADMILTDPENTKDGSFNIKWLKLSFNILKNGKYLCSFCTPSTLEEFIRQAETVGFKHIETTKIYNELVKRFDPCIIMMKGPKEPGTEKRLGEHISFSETKPVDGFPAEAQKPIEFIEIMIKTFTAEGDTVIDPFLGSGTTAIACLNTQRKFKGCEKNPDFCTIAKKRIGITDMSKTGI